MLWIVRTYYSPETPIYDWVEGVRIIGDDAFNKLLLRQTATIVANFSAEVALALSTIGVSTAAKASTTAVKFSTTAVKVSEDGLIAISKDTLLAVNGFIANDLQRRLLLDAYCLALVTATEALQYENWLRQAWQSYETRSIIISIGEINAAWESFYKMGEYQLLTSKLIDEYLGVPDLSERLSDFFISFLPIISDLDALQSREYSNQHLQEVSNLKKNSDIEIHQRALERIDEGKKAAKTTLEQADFFMPLQNQRPEAVGAISPRVIMVGDASETLEVAPYFSSPNNLKYEVSSNPGGIVTESISGSRITIAPVAAGITTMVVIAYDEDSPDLTATQTISVVVRLPNSVIAPPDHPPFAVPERSNPRSEGLREGVSVIIQNVPLTTRGLALRSTPWIGNNEIRRLWDGATGIITDGPEENDGYTWWEIKWDQVDIEDVWSVEAFGGDQLLLRCPPDLEIRDLDVSDDEIAPGEEFELEVEILNNGPGESTATEVYFYYSDNRHSDLEELSEDDDLQGGWTLPVPSLPEGRREKLSLTVEAPTIPDRYYYGALLPSNIHDTDYTGDLTEEVLINNLADEERVEVTSSPDFIVESISVRETTLDPGEAFTLRTTVLNQGLGEPQTTPTLRYYLSSDVRISENDEEVGEDRVSRLDTDETGNESVNLTAPTEPGVYL